MSPETRVPRRKKPSLFWYHWAALGAFALLVLAVGVWLFVTLRELVASARAVQGDVAALQRLAEAGGKELDARRAYELLQTTRSDLARLESGAQPFLSLAPYLGWVPRYGGDIQAAPALLEMGLKLTGAAELAMRPLLPVLETYQAQPDAPKADLLQEVLSALQSAEGDLAAAVSLAQEAQGARQELDASRLSPRVAGWVARLDPYLPLVVPGLESAQVLPEILGQAGSRTYLVLIQNEDELRATGGFISAVAEVTVEQGELKDLAFRDSYAVDDYSRSYPDPPEPLREYMGSDLWLFRDSNWSPDYPTAAQAAIELYSVSQDVNADGAIALGQEAVRLLVGAMGPLQVEGYPEPVTGEDVIELTREAWNPDPESSGSWWLHRKDFMAAVLDAVSRRLGGGLGQDALMGIAAAVLQSLEEKHLLIYLKDARAAGLVAEMGWDGAIRQTSADYVMVVDTNMGFNKVNPLIVEEIEYAVDLSDLGRPYASLIVRHSHSLQRSDVLCRHEPRYGSTYADMMERCYWDYLRVYVPVGVELLEATPHPVSGENLLSGQPSEARVGIDAQHGRTVLSTFLLLPPSQSLETRFRYALPGSTVRSTQGQLEYTLYVQKQPGTRAVPCRVYVFLPQGAELLASDPTPKTNTEHTLEYDLTLDRDRTLGVRLRSLP